MNHNLIVSESIDIHATPEKIWECLTDPNIIRKYLFGTETITSWQEGDNIIFRGTYQDREYTDKGKIVVNRPFQLLEYTYWSGFSGLEDVPENYSLVTYSLEEKDQNTVLTIAQTGFISEQEQSHASETWKKVLVQIKELSEHS